MQEYSFFSFSEGNLLKIDIFPSENHLFQREKAKSYQRKVQFSLENRFWTEENPYRPDTRCMSFQSSFKKILQDKINQQNLFTEKADAASLSTDPAHLAFLLGQISRKPSPTPKGRYSSPIARPQRRPHLFTTAQRLSYDFFKSLIIELPEGFTSAELKKAFRRAALALHPDYGGTPAKFIEMKQHYQVLRSLVGP